MERPLSSPNLEGLDRFSFQPDRVEKPWGHELIWARAEGYAGKLLFVQAGQALSLQFHREKDESWYVLEGRAELQLGEAGQAVLEAEIVGLNAAPGAAGDPGRRSPGVTCPTARCGPSPGWPPRRTRRPWWSGPGTGRRGS